MSVFASYVCKRNMKCYSACSSDELEATFIASIGKHTMATIRLQRLELCIINKSPRASSRARPKARRINYFNVMPDGTIWK
jgi:hypothetical protein